MFDWGWKKAFTALNLRISNLSLDLSAIDSGMRRRDQWISDNLNILYERIDKLEKDNKKLQQLLHCTDKGLVITVTNRNN